MSGGYMGKILRVNLTTGLISTLDTSDYEEWGGGNGMGTAIFWDLVEDRTLKDGLDPRNVVTLMVGPLNGTAVPVVAGRTEVNGISAQSYPNWFTRGNFGGRFGGELKYAGWDGIVLEGKASSKVWIKIVNDSVTLEDGDDLWGLDAWETQEEIWRMATASGRYSGWLAAGNGNTTQKPAVVTIGSTSESLGRQGCLIHDAGNAQGQGGFGAVFASKNLKAISVQGTGSVPVDNPKALMEDRIWFQKTMGNENPYSGYPSSRRAGCVACPVPCKRRYFDGYQNESICVESYFFSAGPTGLDRRKGADLLNRYGYNAWEIMSMPGYLFGLYNSGIIGPGTGIDTAPLAFENYNGPGWGESYLRCMANRQGIGDLLAEGITRAAVAWGRWEEDTSNGRLRYPQWGFPSHWTLPSIEWAYGSLIGDRDINEHDMSVSAGNMRGLINAGLITAQRCVEIFSERCPPYSGDLMMFDYSFQRPDYSNMTQALATGVYSDHKAKLVAYHRHYTRYWKQSIGYCDWWWNRYINAAAADVGYVGASSVMEHAFFNDVTGQNMSFTDGIEIGRKVWNLQRALWVLEGRDRDLEVFTPYMYDVRYPTSGAHMPVYDNGEWTFNYWVDVHPEGMFLDRDGVEIWKTHFYNLEGWNTSNGWPTRATLEGLGIKGAADELEARGRLG